MDRRARVLWASSHLEGSVAGVGGRGLGRHDLCFVCCDDATSKRRLERETSTGYEGPNQSIELVDDINFRASSVGVSGKRRQAKRLVGAATAALLLRHVAATRRELHRPSIAVLNHNTHARHLSSPSSLSIFHLSGQSNHSPSVHNLASVLITNRHFTSAFVINT